MRAASFVAGPLTSQSGADEVEQTARRTTISEPNV
jgi:hypothetical protein